MSLVPALLYLYSFVPSSSGPSPQSPHRPLEVVDVGELIARIQEHVSTNRIRVSEHFQDFDPLRSGSISAARFRQVLVSLKPRLSFRILSGSFWLSLKLCYKIRNRRPVFEARYVTTCSAYHHMGIG